METRVDQLLQGTIVVLNVGLRSFAESLERQQAEVIQIDWAPPAGGDKEMMELLDQFL
jgi:FdrA protein